MRQPLVLFGLGNDLSPGAPQPSTQVLGWDRSRARPVGETARRSVGNRKECLRDYASSPGAYRQRRTPGSALDCFRESRHEKQALS